MTGFLCRNPVLKTKKQFKIDSVRVNSVTSDILKAWFQKLEILAIKAIKLENRWNIDEARIIKG
jgi:4-hydroxybenzoate polyprenyltransferase